MNAGEGPQLPQFAYKISASLLNSTKPFTRHGVPTYDVISITYQHL